MLVSSKFLVSCKLIYIICFNFYCFNFSKNEKAFESWINELEYLRNYWLRKENMPDMVK